MKEFYFKEYEKLKDEQHKRIAFRDQMIYVTLGVIGAVFSFALENPEYNYALLVLPFISIVLGWTYLANDEKISSIGKYLKEILLPKISKDLDTWEDNLKTDKSRKTRKWIQLFVDLAVFCLSGLISILSFFLVRENISISIWILMGAEIIFLAFLGYQFIKYAEI
jgi:L-asparagine transporter-like permease